MYSLFAYFESKIVVYNVTEAKYQKKTNRQAWSEEQMASAIALVESRQCGYMKAAKYKNKTAGWSWLRSFMQRNNLSLRIPRGHFSGKGNSFNKNNVNNFFNLLESVQDRIHFSESQIFNVDETGITTVQGRQSKIIALRGRKQVGCLLLQNVEHYLLQSFA
ncbi:hypothetical protein NQ318_016791 [Aromia moschata]|uniref:Transposase n=1 Tax=Aromia moschata TaxID=1265417 RepID=A0AAV8Y4Y7_9CUCU|nr:hypothetical protein NQ318_016791 [Aromia moschata]